MKWDGTGINCYGMRWDGTEKYVPWTSLEMNSVLGVLRAMSLTAAPTIRVKFR